MAFPPGHSLDHVAGIDRVANGGSYPQRWNRVIDYRRACWRDASRCEGRGGTRRLKPRISSLLELRRRNG